MVVVGAGSFDMHNMKHYVRDGSVSLQSNSFEAFST